MKKLLFLGWKKRMWLIISVAIMIPGIVAVSVWRLPFGIDFKGGAQFEIAFTPAEEQGKVAEKITGYQQVRGPVITKAGENTYFVKMLPITEDERLAIVDNLKKDFSGVEIKQFESVGPSVSQDVTRKAVLAIVLASTLIILYLAYSFRKVAQPVSSWRFGVVAVAALLHDLVITIGVFAILAHYLHYEVDASFITALLTVMGFSVHDTIVVFDRLRENSLKERPDTADEFEALADISLSQTLNRSLATSLTVIFTLTALVVLGGASIRPFVATLLIGIAVGTYSSIFTATPLLVLWQNRVFKKLNQKNG